MFGWTALGGVAVFTGSITGEHSWLAVLVAAVWAFAAGMFVAVSTRAGDLGLNTLVSCIVYGARGAAGLVGATETALLVFAGGLIQMLFAIVLWPIRRYNPVREALGEIYRKLAKEVDPSSEDPFTSALTNPSVGVQDTLAALSRDHSIEGERYRLLFDQADRLRMSIFVLERIRSEMGAEERRTADLDACSKTAGQAVTLAGQIIAAVGDCLQSDACLNNEAALLHDLRSVSKTARHEAIESSAALCREMGPALETLAGQLRMIIHLASHTISTGEAEFMKREASHPWRLQVSNWIGTLRANLNPQSAYCRHAIRLATCVTIGDAIGRIIWWQRSYWIPMTIAVVLKPDFTTTFSRGVLRLAGTFAGLLLATVLYHVFPESALTQLFLVGAFTFFLRSIGPANYGVFSIAISGLIVFLIAATGVPPKEVVAERAVNTAAGGILALIAYALWPTWERMQVSEVMAEMLDACREYFHAIAERFESDRPTSDTDLDPFRNAWRRTRSNAEASVDRFNSEPGAQPAKADCLGSMLASSHALMHSMMGLEAFLLQPRLHTPPETFRVFAHDVELTLYFLASALRGSAGALETLPKLREDHTRMVEARTNFSPEDELALSETDRLTSSLNTLREQVMGYTGAKEPVASPA